MVVATEEIERNPALAAELLFAARGESAPATPAPRFVDMSSLKPLRRMTPGRLKRPRRR